MYQRLENEIRHGKFIAKQGEEIWNWSTPAGKIRWQRRCDFFKKFIGDNNARVLEIGCGTGLFTEELAKTNNHITAIDVSPDLLEKASSRVRRKNVDFELQNAHQTNFTSGSFDFIVGSSVLHHLEVDLALKEFYRLLKPGGKIAFTEPNMMNPQIAAQKNITWLKKIMGDSPDETAFFRWVIKKKLLQAGFSQAKAKPFDFLHPATPRALIFLAKPIGDLFERLPLMKEIAGSLLITAEK